MKEIINVRIEKEVLDQLRNYQLLVGKQSGFVPNRTAVIERLIVLGLEEMTDEYQIYLNTQIGAEDDDKAEIQRLGSEIYNFTQYWLFKDLENIDE